MNGKGAIYKLNTLLLQYYYYTGTKVFALTAVFSLFAYFWLIFVLLANSKDEVLQQYSY